MTRLSTKLTLYAYLIIGFVLRFTASITHSYSSDELSAINRLTFSHFSSLIETGVKTGDMHPAGVQVFLYYWSNFFGTQEWIHRLPFVLMGTASIYLIYRLGKRINIGTGLTAAGLWSILLFPILQSELARPYSPGLFFSLLSGQLILTLLKDPLSNRKKWFVSIGLGFAFATAMYTHYFSFLTVGFLGLSGLLLVKRHTLVPYLVAGGLAMALFLPHLPITLYHLSIDGGLQWLAPPTPSWLFEFLYFGFNSSWLTIGVLLLGVSIGLLKTRRTDFTIFHLVFAIWFFGTFALGYLISIFGTPVLKFPVMLFVFPFFIILISFFLYKIRPSKIIFISVLTTGVIGFSTLIEKRLYANTHFEVFKELVSPIMAWHQKYGANNCINIMNVSHPNYLNYYANRNNYSIQLSLDVLHYQDNELLRSTLSQAKENFCIIGYSGRHTPPYFFKTALAHFPYITAYKKYNNSAVFLLSKTAEHQTEQLKATTIAHFPDLLNSWEYPHDHFMSDQAFLQIDSSLIYGPQIRLMPTKDQLENLDFLSFEISAKLIDPDAKITLVISPEHPDGSPVNNLKGEPIWIGQDLETMLAHNGKAYFALTVPKTLSIHDSLKIYLWNRNAKKIRLTSIKIQNVRNIWN